MKVDIVDKLKVVKLLLEDSGSDYWDIPPGEINPEVIGEAIMEIEGLRMFIAEESALLEIHTNRLKKDLG